MSAQQRTFRDARRRLGQNFLRPALAEILVEEGDFRPSELVVEVGAGMGAFTILRRLLDDPRVLLDRADLVVQWEVARKRASRPPSTLLSTTWAPWWEFRLGRRIAAHEFRPVPKVDAAVLVIRRRSEPLLPTAMASSYAEFVRAHWPFDPRCPA